MLATNKYFHLVRVLFLPPFFGLHGSFILSLDPFSLFMLQIKLMYACDAIQPLCYFPFLITVYLRIFDSLIVASVVKFAFSKYITRF